MSSSPTVQAMDLYAPVKTSGAWSARMAGELSQAADVTQLIGHLVTCGRDAQLSLGDAETDGLALSFVGGELLRVHSTAAVPTLLQGLQQEGRLSIAQLSDAIAQGFADAESAVAHLVDAGLLRAQTSRALLIAHQGRLFHEALGRQVGAFSLSYTNKPDDLSTPWAPKERLLLDGIRVTYDAERMAALLQPSEAALALASPAPESWGLKDAERRWVSLLDGKLSIAAAAEHAELPLLAAQQLALGLLRLRCAHFVGDLRRSDWSEGPVAETADEAADADREPADAELLAQKVRLARERDYFAVLGLCPTALPSEVAAAAAALLHTFATQHWPSEQRADATELCEVIDDARDVLLDARRAAQYAQSVS